MNTVQIWLLLAIIFEVAGTTSMKLSEGFNRALPSLLIFVFYGLSFTALTMALKHLDLSVAYVIWAGLGTVLIVLIGFLYFGEQPTAFKAACIALIVIGVAGLKHSA
jgi:small multidrug resistance pump